MRRLFSDIEIQSSRGDSRVRSSCPSSGVQTFTDDSRMHDNMKILLVKMEHINFFQCQCYALSLCTSCSVGLSAV